MFSRKGLQINWTRNVNVDVVYMPTQVIQTADEVRDHAQLPRLSISPFLRRLRPVHVKYKRGGGEKYISSS